MAEKLIPLLTAIMFVLLQPTPAFPQGGASQASTAVVPSPDGQKGESSQSTVNSPTSTSKETAPANPAPAPLIGADDFTPGSTSPGRSYLLPSFQWTGYGTTNPTGTPGHSQLATQSIYLGNITLQSVQRQSQLNLAYSGGAFFFSENIAPGVRTQPRNYGSFHSLGFNEVVNRRRWRLQLSDQLTYLPEAAFGFAGFGGLGSFGLGAGGGYFANAPVLSPALVPNQTILTGNSRRLSNFAAAQVQYNAGERSAITALGGYGTLHFLDSGFIDSDYWTLLTGYNHALTRQDVLAVGYEHILFRFKVMNREILIRGLQLAYGRRVTGRISFQASGGAVISQVALPLGGAVTRSFWSTYDSLQYRFRRGNAGVSFLRYTTGGSGLLLGAESDVTTMTIGRQFFRNFFASLDLGHAYNQSLTQQTPAQRRSKYEGWVGDTTLSRELGQHWSAYVSYYVQRQQSNAVTCFGNTCGTTLFRQAGGVGINWHSRPIRLD